MKYTIVALTILAAFSIAIKINDRCVVENNTDLACSCIGNEKFTMPSNIEYERVKSVLVTSCDSAEIDLSSFPKTNEISSIVIRDIKRSLAFRGFLKTEKLQLLKLLRIRKIVLMSSEIFAGLTEIVNLRMEETRIENIEEQFASTNVIFFTMKNVTIDKMIGINFSERGESLIIHDSSIKEVQTSLNFAFFKKIDVRNSTFVLKKPGHISIEGNSAVVLNSVFTNISMNLVASNDITINASCADGKSSLRLSANKIESFGNRLPTEIVYTRNSRVNDENDEYPLIVNNTVCIAGNCKCPKSAGHNSYERFHANIYLGTLLIVLASGLF